MSVRVIIPPEPIVEPADIAGSHAADDAAVLRMIRAAQGTIDGPTGSLNRSFGIQTLELTLDGFCGHKIRLPCGPVIAIDTVSYLDEDESEQTIDAGDFRQIGSALWFRSSFSLPFAVWARDALRIVYQAGCDGNDVGSGGTGEVPDEARQAIVVLVQHLKAVGAENLFLRSLEVPNVLTKTYTVSDQAGALVQRTVDSLLSGLRVYSL